MTPALREAIERAKCGDDLARVDVIAPSGLGAQSMARQLGLNGGVVNVRFTTVTHWAREAVVNSEHQFLANEVKYEFARIVAHQARPPLDGYNTLPLAQSLFKVFEDLRSRSDAEVDLIRDISAQTAEIVRLYREFRLLTSSYLDDRSVVEQAVLALENGKFDPVVAVVVDPPVPHVSHLLNRLYEKKLLTVVAVDSGDEALDGALRTSLWGIDFDLVDDSVSETNIRRVVIAQDGELEVQRGIVECLDHVKRGVPFSRMAIIHGSANPYAQLIHGHLKAADIPWRGKSDQRLSQSLAGRFASTYLELFEAAGGRDHFAHWINSAPILHYETREVVPASSWTQLFKTSRVDGEMASWSQRLKQDDLRLFVERLYSEQPAFDSWSDWAKWLQRSLTSYLGNLDERSGWLNTENRSFQEVERLLLQLSALDGLSGGNVDIRTFKDAFREGLTSPQPRNSGSGIFVGGVRETIGQIFDVVIVCGMAEGVFPTHSSGDVLSRSLLVPGEELKVDRDRRAFLNLVTGSKHVMMTSPRIDQRAQSERRPSPWIIEQASSVAGCFITANDLLANKDNWEWLEVIESFTAGLSSRQIISNSHSIRLAEMQDEFRSQDVLTENAVTRHRDSETLTAYDGLVGANQHLSNKTLSPTALEHWAVCPFRYFLSTVLEVESRDEEEDLTKTAAKDRGNLVHKTLERFYKTVSPRVSPSQPWTDEERALLHKIADELYEKSRQDGLSPEGLLLEIELSTLHSHLDMVLDEDQRYRSQRGLVPDVRNAEVEFSNLQISLPDSVPVRFRGRIDRVDKSLDSTLLVATDYKTGRADRYPDLDKDPVAKGTKFQLAVYAEALASTAPSASIEADYWFVADELSGYARKGIDLDETTRDRFREALGHVASGIEQGLFPAVPGNEVLNSHENCRHCPYDAVCPVDRAEIWDRKSSDPACDPYFALDGDNE